MVLTSDNNTIISIFVYFTRWAMQIDVLCRNTVPTQYTFRSVRSVLSEYTIFNNKEEEINWATPHQPNADVERSEISEFEDHGYSKYFHGLKSWRFSLKLRKQMTKVQVRTAFRLTFCLNLYQLFDTLFGLVLFSHIAFQKRLVLKPTEK